jgi:hypothetical protein
MVRCVVGACVLVSGCSASSSGSGFDDGTGDAAMGADSPISDGSTGQQLDASFGGDAGPASPGEGGTTTTIYANTDDSLYSMDPQAKSVTLIGKFAGMGGGTGDNNVTDCAVNGNGDVFVNTESVVYKAALPSAPGTVQLTKVAPIALKQGQRFYALAFAPAGVLGAGETLVGGDGNGELWSIDATNGTTRDLGAFGADPRKSGNVFALSGDVVFYIDSTAKPTGLATIRSCQKGTSNCTSGDDYLAGIDMGALAAAFNSSTPAATLLAGIYGGSTANPGSGTSAGELFGLGAWEGDVYAFERASGSATKTPALLEIDTTSGKGNVVSSSFSFSNGWSGAGVTTKVTVSVPPPPK